MDTELSNSVSISSWQPAKKAITRRWLNAQPPTVNRWEAKDKDIQTMKLTNYILILQRVKGDALWEKWSTYITRWGDNLLYIYLVKKNNDHIAVIVISGNLLTNPWLSHVLFLSMCPHSCEQLIMFMIIWAYSTVTVRETLARPVAQSAIIATYILTFSLIYNAAQSIKNKMPQRQMCRETIY